MYKTKILTSLVFFLLIASLAQAANPGHTLDEIESGTIYRLEVPYADLGFSAGGDSLGIIAYTNSPTGAALQAYNTNTGSKITFGIGSYAIYSEIGTNYFAGNVGIGTTTPSAKLEVVGGPIKATGGLIIESRTNDPASPVDGQMWLRTDIS